MQKVKLIVILVILNFFCTQSFASDLIKGIHLIKQGKGKSGVQLIENFYKNASTTSEAIDAAMILSTAPAKYIKLKPFQYAEFVIKNNAQLSTNEKYKYLRIAGDGLFNNAKFNSAKKWYGVALKISDLNDEKKEYSAYKIAWCEINLNKPHIAFKIISDWLLTKKASLKNALIFDMARSMGESVFAGHKLNFKKTVNSLKLNKEDIAEFNKGLLISAKRSKAKFSQVYEIIKQLDFASDSLNQILVSKPYKEQSVCEGITVYQFGDARFWQGENSKLNMENCAIKVIKLKVDDLKPYRSLNEVLASYKITSELSWLLAKINHKLNNSDKACDLMVNAIDKSVVSESKLQAWVVDTVTHCREDKLNKTLLSHKPKLKNKTVYEVLFHTDKISYKNKNYLFQQLKAEGNNDLIYNTMLDSLSEVEAKEFLSKNCKSLNSNCLSLWQKGVELKQWPTEMLMYKYSKSSPEKQNKLLSALIKEGKQNIILTNIDLFEQQVIKDKKLLSELVYLSIDQESDVKNKFYKKIKIHQFMTNIDVFKGSLVKSKVLVGTNFYKDYESYIQLKIQFNNINILKINKLNLEKKLLQLKETIDNSKKYSWSNNYFIKKIVVQVNTAVNHLIVSIDTLKFKHLGDWQWFGVIKEVNRWRSI